MEGLDGRFQERLVVGLEKQLLAHDGEMNLVADGLAGDHADTIDLLAVCIFVIHDFTIRFKNQVFT